MIAKRCQVYLSINIPDTFSARVRRVSAAASAVIGLAEEQLLSWILDIQAMLQDMRPVVGIAHSCPAR